jgi:hypothetical protein
MDEWMDDKNLINDNFWYVYAELYRIFLFFILLDWISLEKKIKENIKFNI